ncbi:VOC family protein [Nitratireductor sp. GCM10026969]|uniref:VOC family protein n=1 Tax=Nitratireductor sp. GCM10026969 TaxID=3252645 RepID=UPI00360DE977
MKPTFNGGRNIAMKVPPHQYEATVAFYRDILGLEPIEHHQPAIGFKFGMNQLWIDRAPGMSQAELWLEVVTDDIGAAEEHLRQAGIARCDEIEDLGEGFAGFWISSPASIIHLIDLKSGAW